jgi:hypothetical protein
MTPPNNTADRGEADPKVAQALDDWDSGQITEREMLETIRGSRVLVPVVAVAMKGVGGESGKQTDMAIPRLVGKDGRAAMMAFTSVDSLSDWEPDARPVPMPARQACEAAIAEDCALVVDVGGPVQVTLEGARLNAIANGEPVPPAHEDPDVRAIVESVATLVALTPEEGRDVVVEVRAASEDEASETAQAITSLLGRRLRTIEVRAWL